MTEQIQTREEKLIVAKLQREQEVENYQINVDNYTLAIAEIDAMPEADRVGQAEFRGQLAALLVAEKREQAKAQIMLNVLRKQLEPVAV